MFLWHFLIPSNLWTENCWRSRSLEWQILSIHSHGSQRCIEWQVVEIVFLFRNNPLMKVPLPGIRKTCGCMQYIRKILQLQHVSCLDLVEAHRLDTSVTEKQSWRILKWTLTLLHSGRKLFPWRIPAFLLAMNWTLLSLRRWRFWRRKSD